MGLDDTAKLPPKVLKVELKQSDRGASQTDTYDVRIWLTRPLDTHEAQAFGEIARKGSEDISVWSSDPMQLSYRYTTLETVRDSVDQIEAMLAQAAEDGRAARLTRERERREAEEAQELEFQRRQSLVSDINAELQKRQQ